VGCGARGAGGVGSSGLSTGPLLVRCRDAFDDHVTSIQSALE
jgi:hypothetical protein